ncbi:peptide-methionine (S)-S-oxide reductase [Oceanihabitans sp.]|nr:peptide-methionine (S)-S-oxide reductase [Oceanihabitans sp.]
MDKLIKIGFGGGCHWCTEAVFQSLKGVYKVDQGYIASDGKNHSFSEAVIVYFNPLEIALKSLIEIHLYTHKSTSNHRMRDKYRSAVYSFSNKQERDSKVIIENLQQEFDGQIITTVIPFLEFKASREAIQNYYQKHSDKPFCRNYINPKLEVLLQNFSETVIQEKFN